MTGVDLLHAMGAIDDRFYDEALRAERKHRTVVLRRTLAAACAGLVLLGGVFALLHAKAGGPTSVELPAQTGVEQVEETPIPTDPPTRENGATVPPEETPPTERNTPAPPIMQIAVPPAPTATPTPTPMPTPTPTPTPASGAQRPQPGTDPAPQPQPTATPSQESPTGEFVIPTPTPAASQLDPSGADELNCSLQYDSRLENGAIIPLKIIIHWDDASNDNKPYTDIQFEADGFEIISQNATDSGADFLLRISDDQPEGHAAVLTLNIMDGDEVNQSLILYAAATERGTYVNEGGTRGLWGNYYYDRYNDGEFEDYEYERIVYVIHTSYNPSLEDPVPTDPLTSYLWDNGASNEASGEASGGFSGE